MARVEVAVGVILDPAGEQVLLSRRADDAHQGGLWEFPGGKREDAETIEAALARELREELAITVTACDPLLRIEHDYSDKSVALDVWLVTAFEGDPQPVEAQPLRWVAIEALHELPFPAANTPIVEALQCRVGEMSSERMSS